MVISLCVKPPIIKTNDFKESTIFSESDVKTQWFFLLTCTQYRNDNNSTKFSSYFTLFYAMSRDLGIAVAVTLGGDPPHAETVEFEPTKPRN